jgi:flagellar hook-associated protein 2
MTGVSLSGLGSGLDINTIVTQLMAIERRPQQLMERRKVTFETAGTAIDGIRTKMQDLRFAAADIGSVAGWNNVAAKSSDETRAKVTSIAGGSSTGSIRFAIETLAGSRTLATTTNFAAGATVASGSIDLTVKGTTHNISVGGGTIEEVAAAINDANVGASASLVQVTPGNFKLQINAESGAASNDLAVTGVSGGGWITVSTGFDARIRVGGSGGSGGYTVTSSDNFFDNVLPGTKIEAIRSAATTYVRVTTEPDSSKVADNVQKMVDKLNELAKDINEKTKIDPQANTRGPLAGNAAVRGARVAISDAVLGDVASNAGAYGISIARDGTYTFDRAKFTAAYEADPTATKQAFTDPTTGIGARIAAAAANTLDPGAGVLTSARDANRTQIDNLTRSISQYAERMTRKEEQLRKQFAALDSNIGSLRNQSNWLSQQLGNLNRG